VVPGADRQAYLYLAGSGVLVRTGGPVGVYREPGALRLTLPARGVVTLTGDTAALPAGRYAEGRVEVLPRISGRPVLNAVPLFGKVSAVKQAGPDAAARGVAVLEQGLELLAGAWPAMRALVDRWVGGFVVIDYEGCARSHTSSYAPHVLMCTCESPVAVAEALCHETSHGRLFVLAQHHKLLVDDYVARHASPWRPDRRPLVSFLNGIHAFVTVCQFYRRLADLDPRYLPTAERAIARQAPRIVQAWDYLQSHATWSPMGQRVAATLSPLVEDLRP
jgi:HEXXH motif-containing protein